MTDFLSGLFRFMALWCVVSAALALLLSGVFVSSEEA